MVMAFTFRPRFFYKLFFLWIEPASTIIGAYFAHFRPVVYLQLTHIASAPVSEVSLPISTQVSLSQLANLYFLFAVNEGLVLRATSDLRVWRTLLFGLLIADFGHLLSVYPLGIGIYYRFWKWNAIDWGNIGFVYVGALTRLSFLCGWGVTKDGIENKKPNQQTQ
jgi:hypothetical protein